MASDTALVVSVDVSQSVDHDRYRLQMEGIAQALEDPGVIDAILSGPGGGILFSLVTWADSAELALSWRRIASKDDALRVAEAVRKVPQRSGEFTCVARMMTYIAEFVAPEVRTTASRLVVDVSGDGIDNCSDRESSDAERDRLIATDATINGLPIIVPGENEVVGSGAYRAPGFGLRELRRGPDTDTTTLDSWYRDHIIGGAGAFLLPANGFTDFGRAFRQKFVTEISGLVPGKMTERSPDIQRQ